MVQADSVVWRKSRRCESGACVEVAEVPAAVLVRDSKDPGGPRLAFTTAAWRAFVGGVKARAFDRR